MSDARPPTKEEPERTFFGLTKCLAASVSGALAGLLAGVGAGLGISAVLPGEDDTHVWITVLFMVAGGLVGAVSGWFGGSVAGDCHPKAE